MSLSGAQVTRQWPYGGPGHNYGSFVGKAAAVVVAVVAEQPSGGWESFLSSYESQLQRRRERARQQLELEEETEKIEATLDRNIAQLQREQEAIDSKREYLKNLADLARQNADIEAARQYSEKVGKAYEIALTKGTLEAINRLDKELKKAAREEQELLIAMMLLLE